jgi:hypothetical protein
VAAMFCCGLLPECLPTADFRTIAFVGYLPFVVGFDENRAGQAQQRRRVGEDANQVGAALDFLLR